MAKRDSDHPLLTEWMLVPGIGRTVARGQPWPLVLLFVSLTLISTILAHAGGAACLCYAIQYFPPGSTECKQAMICSGYLGDLNGAVLYTIASTIFVWLGIRFCDIAG